MVFNKVRFLVTLPLFGLSIMQTVSAQQLVVREPLAYDKKELWFDNIVSRQNTSLINGPEYFMPFKGATTNPFFGSSMEQTNEEVKYENQLYENVPLLYDLYSDVLVLRIHDSNGLFAMVSVDKNKAESFTLYGHRFQKMLDPKSEKGAPVYRYYDVLFAGKNITLVAQRTKSRYVSGLKTEYDLEEKYYFIKQGHWAQLSNAKSFYALMTDKKSNITDFIATKKIKVRKKNEKDLIAIAAFCNSLEGV